jgi:hypothetical protein
MTALTRIERSPFKIEISPRYAVDFWNEEYVTWRWRLIGADGVCLESGGGFPTAEDAMQFAERVACNDMA